MFAIESETIPRMMAVTPAINERRKMIPAKALASLVGRLVATIKKTIKSVARLPMPVNNAAFESPAPPPPPV